MTATVRRVIVSGGTGGLGRATVAELLAAGARVAVPYRDARAFDRLRAEIPEPGRLWGAPVDLADAEATSAFTSAAVDWLGGLDGLACLAGAYAGGGPLHAAPADEWPRMLNANLQSAYTLCRAALPRLGAGGSVVLVSSRVVRTGGAGSAAYAVSKAAVEALARALAGENRARGVRVNCVAPGTIDTPANRSAMPDADQRAWTPPEQIAAVVRFLLGGESAPVTGALLPVDGRG